MSKPLASAPSQGDGPGNIRGHHSILAAAIANALHFNGSFPTAMHPLLLDRCAGSYYGTETGSRLLTAPVMMLRAFACYVKASNLSLASVHYCVFRLGCLDASYHSLRLLQSDCRAEGGLESRPQAGLSVARSV